MESLKDGTENENDFKHQSEFSIHDHNKCQLFKNTEEIQISSGFEIRIHNPNEHQVYLRIYDPCYQNKPFFRYLMPLEHYVFDVCDKERNVSIETIELKSLQPIEITTIDVRSGIKETQHDSTVIQSGEKDESKTRNIFTWDINDSGQKRHEQQEEQKHDEFDWSHTDDLYVVRTEKPDSIDEQVEGTEIPTFEENNVNEDKKKQVESDNDRILEHSDCEVKTEQANFSDSCFVKKPVSPGQYLYLNETEKDSNCHGVHPNYMCSWIPKWISPNIKTLISCHCNAMTVSLIFLVSGLTFSLLYPPFLITKSMPCMDSTSLL